ncbi:hypothetical protein RB597_005209 [Gaeumannomyces tritici]
MKTAMPPKSCIPAAYGQACAGCVRGKCKCMLRQDGAGCERCHRLGKQCEPSAALRKRKSQSPPPDVPNAQRPRQGEPSIADAGSTPRLEAKIDDLVSLLHAHITPGSGKPLSLKGAAVVSLTTDPPPSATPTTGADSLFPDIVMDSATASIQLVRPAATSDPADGAVGWPSSAASSAWMSPVAREIQAASKRWYLYDTEEDKRMREFNDSFITVFPFVTLNDDLSAQRLFEERPFLWLVIMTLTEKSITQQFAMEETIWNIISRRIVAEQLANLDLLLGLIFFTNWSHVFKKEKPFASMTLKLAINMAQELDLHREAPAFTSYRTKGGQLVPQTHTEILQRTLEERRTMLALFQISSSVWASFRKAEPLPWTPYLDSCIIALEKARQTIRDLTLIAQVRCQIILNQLSCPSQNGSPIGPSEFMTTTLLQQLNAVRQKMPSFAQVWRCNKRYLLHVELAIKGLCLDRPGGRQSWQPAGNAGVPSNIRRARELEAVLEACEQWMAAFQTAADPLGWIADVDLNGYVQMTHCLVQLFRLHTLPDDKCHGDGDGDGGPGLDLADIRRRADVFKVIDTLCDEMDKIPGAYEMVDAPGPRRGLFFKAAAHLRIIKGMMLSQLPEHMKRQREQEQRSGDKDAQQKEQTCEPPPPPPQQPQPPESLELPDPQSSSFRADAFSSADFSDDLAFLDNAVIDQASEPWIMDFLSVSFATDQPQGLYYIPDAHGY